MTEPDQPQWLAVGRIMRAHGVRGEVSVLPLSEVEARFEPDSILHLGESEDRTLTVKGSRGHHGRLLVAFEDVSGRDEAEALRGEYLFVPAGSAPDLPEGDYWPHQLIGCEVLTEDGRSLGRIREIVRTPANDVWAAGPREEEVLIPALKEVVRSVDVDAGKVVVREVPGLTAPEP